MVSKPLWKKWKRTMAPRNSTKCHINTASLATLGVEKSIREQSVKQVWMRLTYMCVVWGLKFLGSSSIIANDCRPNKPNQNDASMPHYAAMGSTLGRRGNRETWPWPTNKKRTNATSIPNASFGSRVKGWRRRRRGENVEVSESVDAKYVRSIDATKAFPRAPSNAPALASRGLQKVIETEGASKGNRPTNHKARG